ncbi:MAG: putative toxin-antitoxin system toxin component, PIN family [Anaerolineaceae bacterium]|nr:putative toxin-antitoxin system toxin component, PIN family [Anaerolineaceae bacterium]
MIRAVCDTNIVVSAFFWGGLPRQVLDAARAKHCQLIATEELLAELTDVLSRPKFARALAQLGETPYSIIEFGYRSLVEVVEAKKINPVVIDDPDDDQLIACAVGGNAHYIVSGDHHLLSIGTYQNIKLITIRDFLEIIVI